MVHPLLIDVREACKSKKTGKGQWTYGFVSELLKRGIPLTLVTDRAIPPEWTSFPCRVEYIPGRSVMWHVNVIRFLRRNPGAAYVSPVSYIVPAFAPRSVRCIPIVHDLIAFLHEPHDRKAKWIERLTLGSAVRKADRVCTISESTKHDLLTRYPFLLTAQVAAIFAGPMDPNPEPSAIPSKVILCIATLCPRKNQLRLIQAYSSLPDELRSVYRLVLAGGRGWDDAPILKAAKRAPGVELLGYIDGSAYESLIRTCSVFALPSLYEGFGMQILDAMQRGVPVLTSDRGSLRELAQGAAFIVDPTSVLSITDGLKRLLTDDALRTELRQKGTERASHFSWKRTVDLFLECYHGGR
ncbi:glycosyltransferase family 1 protein [Candidatus Peribacteria bacterium]|nr:glycosyltransferase family 1 protein [Candidatus Peribacteria bacterium]